MLKWIAIVVVLLVAGLMAYVRLAPSDPQVWHTAPLTAPLPTTNGWLVRPTGGNAPSPVVTMEVQAALTVLDAIAMATPRTTRLTGSVAEGQITYVTRSRLIGYPDYTTVTALPVTGGTALILNARQRFGAGDMGVNRARVESWLAQMPGS